MTKKTYVLGTSNNNTPGLYRKYNCYDHLFHYELRPNDVPDTTMKLTLAMEAFNSLVTQQLGIDPAPERVDPKELGAYQAAVAPEKVLQRMLKVSPLAQEVRVEVGSDDRQIYLCRNYIVELNENLAKLTQITVLQTCCNYLRKLPCGIGQLANLRMLILSRNRLVALPDEIGFCTQLSEIDVSYNLLKELPRSIVALKKLSTLHITGNAFEELPSFLGKLQSLKYLGISRNKIKTIPLEVFKLPFLLSISYDHPPETPQRRFEEVGRISLQELAARQIVRENCAIPRQLPVSLREYLLGVDECAFCGGPYFDYHVAVVDFHCFESTIYPVRYNMCSKHYASHAERLPTLFERRITTMPIKLIQDSIPSITELFEPIIYSDAQVRRICEAVTSSGETVPLIALSRFNPNTFRRLRPDRPADETIDDLNIFEQSL